MRAALLALCLALSAPLRAGEAKLERFEDKPESVPAALGAVLGAGLRASIDGKVVAELWPVKQVALRPQDNLILGTQYGRLVEGSLVGVARLPEKWTDYRGKAVAAGTYTLRYAVQPADGNHMGVSEYRDYLLLSPVSADPDPKALSRDDLLASSKKASGTNHPAVMSLVAVPKEGLERDGDTLSMAANAGSFAFGLVVRGHSQGP